jgi:hypothetical protein
VSCSPTADPTPRRPPDVVVEVVRAAGGEVSEPLEGHTV